jgi:hypothetical protein
MLQLYLALAVSSAKDYDIHRLTKMSQIRHRNFFGHRRLDQTVKAISVYWFAPPLAQMLRAVS